MLAIRFRKEGFGHTWDARRGKSRIDGSGGGGPRDALPHDLVGLVIERHLGVHGFWWAVERGATFRSMRKKATKPGRAVIHAHHLDIKAAEHAVHEVEGRWRRGEPTPVSAELDRLAGEWAALPVGATYETTYVSPTTTAGRARAPRRSSPRPTRAPARSGAGRRSRS